MNTKDLEGSTRFITDWERRDELRNFWYSIPYNNTIPWRQMFECLKLSFTVTVLASPLQSNIYTSVPTWKFAT